MEVKRMLRWWFGWTRYGKSTQHFRVRQLLIA
jgi:hypothetical protein